MIATSHCIRQWWRGDPEIQENFRPGSGKSKNLDAGARPATRGIDKKSTTYPI